MKFTWLVLTAATAQLQLQQQPSYDNIILTFDPACQEGGDQSLTNFITRKRSSKLRARSNTLQALNGLETLAESELDTVVEEVVAKRVHRGHRREAARRQLRGEDGFRLLSTPVSSRLLKDTPEAQREDEILGMLHLMATLGVAEGNVEAAKLLLAGERKHAFNRTMSELGISRSFAAKSPVESVTNPRSLEFIRGMKVVGNPLLGASLLEYAALLPCLKGSPEPDMIVDTEPVDETVRAIVPGAKPKLDDIDYEFIDMIDGEILELRMAEERATGVTSLNNFGRQTQRWWLKRFADDKNVQPYQWLTYSGKEGTWGAGYNSAWVMLAKDVLLEEHPEFKQQAEVTVTYEEVVGAIKRTYGSPIVGVVDTGCYRQADLLPNFWRNPMMAGCDGSALVGTGGDDGYGHENACIGYDFCSDIPDPTAEVTGFHGTGVSGLIAAEGNNGLGTVGACPWCRIMCLKSSEGGDLRTRCIVAAGNFAIAHGAEITNHSYGMYSNSSSLHAMHKALNAANILSTTSAGNAGCDIDQPKSDECPGIHGPSLNTLHFPGTVSVGATGWSGIRADVSNWGASQVNIFAPGQDVSVLMQPDTVGTRTGTSYASPVAAGVAAILKTKYPTISNADIKTIMQNSAQPLPELNGKAQNGGIIAAHRALAYAELLFGCN